MPLIVSPDRKQQTLKKSIEFSGIGIHTGELVTMTLNPAKAGSGYSFVRNDLPGKPSVQASLVHVIDTNRSTTIGTAECRVHTVEHVLAALRACNVDNVRIELSNMEPPVGNGSSDVFVEMVEEVGVVEQEAPLEVFEVDKPIAFCDGDISLVALPYDGFKISYTLNYPGVKPLETQFHSLEVTHDSFKEEIAPCRTFALWEEISMLIDHGLIRGGSLANAVVVQKNAILSKGGLFFKNEAARHKILDLIGDLSLIGYPIKGHVISIKSGHGSNFSFSKELMKS